MDDKPPHDVWLSDMISDETGYVLPIKTGELGNGLLIGNARWRLTNG
jgi:hypothetical protein